MIFGVGIDIVKIERMKEADEKWGKTFFGKIMTDDEIKYCYRKNVPYPSLAVRFAAKEAFIKALGNETISNMKNIEVVNDAKGRPSIKVSDKLEKLLQKHGIKQCHLSLSHEREFGVACVILETGMESGV